MPIVFQNTASAVFFWIFLSAFLASAVCHAALCLGKLKRWRMFSKPLPMLFLALALVCLAPQYQLAVLACFLFTVADCFFAPEKPSWLFSIGAVISTGALVLELVVFVPLLPFAVPAYAYGIVAGGVLLFGLGGYFTRGKRDAASAAVGMAHLGTSLAVLVFSVLLLADVPLYNEILTVVGFAFFVAYAMIGQFAYNRRFSTTVPYFVGQVCIFFGLILSLANFV